MSFQVILTPRQYTRRQSSIWLQSRQHSRHFRRKQDQTAYFGAHNSLSVSITISQACIFARWPELAFLDWSPTMHRAPFVAPVPAQSPPLHHPIPQHVSSIPMMRTPPPSMPPQSTYQAAGYMPQNPYQPAPAQGGSGTFGPQAFGNFVTDPAAQMGIHVGKNAMFAGHNYLQQNVRVVPFSGEASPAKFSE